MAHGPSRSAACGIFPDQGSNPCPLHWQADSQPLRHQGSPIYIFNCWFHWVFVAVRRLSLVAASEGLPFVVVRGLLNEVASLEEHGLQVHGLQYLWRAVSVVVARGL